MREQGRHLQVPKMEIAAERIGQHQHRFVRAAFDENIEALTAIRDMDQRETIKSIKNSVLVIAGRHDPGTSPAMNAFVATSIEGAKFVTLEASHMANIEDAANFTQAAVDFLTAGERES
jgi:pimeloyl-ACP methyl ester carboxylesterase